MSIIERLTKAIDPDKMGYVYSREIKIAIPGYPRGKDGKIVTERAWEFWCGGSSRTLREAELFRLDRELFNALNCSLKYWDICKDNFPVKTFILAKLQH